MVDMVLDNLIDRLIDERISDIQYTELDQAWNTHVKSKYHDIQYDSKRWKETGNNLGYEKVGNIENVLIDYKMKKQSLGPNNPELKFIRESDMINLYRDTIELLGKSPETNPFEDTEMSHKLFNGDKIKGYSLRLAQVLESYLISQEIIDTRSPALDHYIQKSDI